MKAFFFIRVLNRYALIDLSCRVHEAVVFIMTSVVDDSGVPNTGIGAPAQRPMRSFDPDVGR